MADRDGLLLKINGVPAQPYHLAAAQAVESVNYHTQLNGITFRYLKKLSQPLFNIDAPGELLFLVLLEQIRTVDKRRLSDYIGRLNETHIRGIHHALAISIGLIEPAPPKLTL